MKPKIAMVTPLPPHPTGIADYAAELLPALGRLADTDVFYIGMDPEPIAGVTIRHFSELARLARSYDAVIVQVSNGSEFAPVVDLASRHKCMVVLHDLNLSGIYGGKYLASGNVRGFFEEVRRQEGVKAYLESALRFGLTRRCPEAGDYDMNSSVVRNARRILVHSQATAECLESRHGRLPIAVVPHGTPEVKIIDHDTKQSARRALGLPEDAYVLGVFGTLDERKRIQVILEAAEEVSHSNPMLYICFVGLASKKWESAVSNSRIADRIRVTGRVSLECFYDYIAAVDLCANLRYPWHGEESGPVLRIMASGKPVMVSNIGAFAELPDNACLKIDAGEAELEDLVRTINAAITGAIDVEAIGTAAHSYCLRERGWQHTADGYLAAVEALRSQGANS